MKSVVAVWTGIRYTCEKEKAIVQAEMFGDRLFAAAWSQVKFQKRT